MAEPIEPGATEVAMAAQRDHVFANQHTCRCGYEPITVGDWEHHRMRVAVLAVAGWLRVHSSPTLRGDPFILAAEWAAKVVEREAP
jgi:hypothetical protein